MRKKEDGGAIILVARFPYFLAAPLFESVRGALGCGGGCLDEYQVVLDSQHALRCFHVMVAHRK